MPPRLTAHDFDQELLILFDAYVHGHLARALVDAGFVVAIAGDVMTMPGLPAVPATNGIDVNDAGQITGLS